VVLDRQVRARVISRPREGMIQATRMDTIVKGMAHGMIGKEIGSMATGIGKEAPTAKTDPTIAGTKIATVIGAVSIAGSPLAPIQRFLYYLVGLVGSQLVVVLTKARPSGLVLAPALVSIHVRVRVRVSCHPIPWLEKNKAT